MKICVAFPIETNEISSLKKEIDEILELRPDFIEFRLDYIKDADLLTGDFLKELLGCLEEKIPAIFTFRNSKEGGQMTIEDKKRWEIINRTIDARPEFVDIEMKNEDEPLKDAIHNAIEKKVNLIFSYHDFDKTPDYIIAKEIIQKFEEKIQNLKIDDKEIMEKSIVKLIFYAKKLEDNSIPMRLCKFFSSQNQKIISFCMGDLGVMSRIYCVKAGSHFTFGSYKEKTAPGQIQIKYLRDILESSA